MQCLYFEATQLHDACDNTEAVKPVFFEKQIRQLVTIPGQLMSSTSGAEFVLRDIPGRPESPEPISRFDGWSENMSSTPMAESGVRTEILFPMCLQ